MASEKTEKPSARKLKKARDRGQVPRSRDLSTAIGLIVALQIMLLAAPTWREDLRVLFALAFANLSAKTDANGGTASALDDALALALPGAARLTALMVLPLAAIPLCVSVGALFPGGWVASVHNLKPKLQRLSPLANAKRLLSLRHIGTFALGTLKTAVLVCTLWVALKANFVSMLRLSSLPLNEAIGAGTGQIINIMAVLLGVVAVFGLLDAPFQRFVFLRDQRMSKQDVRREHKESEGSPEVRQRIRQIQRQFALGGLRRTVPQADVVVVNPQHYAVALKYDAERADAPFVVAKGIDEMALAIRQIANAHGVDVLCMPPLARAVYHTSQVNQQIPASLYRAVAIVLSYVMQLDAYRRGDRPQRPVMPDTVPVPNTIAASDGS